MRNEGIVKFLFLCTIGLAGAILLNFVLLKTVRRQYAPAATAAASIFNISGQIHEWTSYITRWKQLSVENAQLKASAEQYVAAEAQVQSLQDENEALRKSAGLASRLKRRIVPAGIFNVSMTASGYSALINKGSREGILEGQAVISGEGMLIGKVAAVFTSSSRVMLTSDPAFSATIRVLGRQTSGILRGALSDGLTVDLVTQSDDIVEGDSLVTTGDDLIPAGLAAGVVRHVENNDTQLFKKVKVNPAADLSHYPGTVLVVQQ